MYLPINEGKDHINIYSKSSLLLGRKLSNFAHTPFICEGKAFASVEAYWYYLKSGEKYEWVRDLFGFTAKQKGRALPRIQGDGFNDRVLEAIRCKLRQNREILKELAESELPLAHYYFFWYSGRADSL